jgi:hypothetical protein
VKWWGKQVGFTMEKWWKLRISHDFTHGKMVDTLDLSVKREGKWIGVPIHYVKLCRSFRAV